MEDQIRVTCEGAATIDLDELTDFQGNLKKISALNLERLKSRIRRHGINAPVFVWRVNGVSYIIDGHQRVKALQALRDEGCHIPPVPLALIEAENITDARDKLLGISSQYGEFVLEEFHAFAADLDLQNDIRLVDGELAITAPKEEVTEGDDDVIDDPIPVASPGDVWQLGPHRVLCGDSTNAEDVGRLMDGVRPHLMVTDPPYGVEYDPSWRASAGINGSDKKLGVVANDDRADWRAAYELFPGDVAYVWHAGIYAGTVADGLLATGFQIRAQIIWAKDRFALSRGHYHWQHEPCWYGVRSKGHWAGDRRQTTLWTIPAREDEGHGHGTQKPVECMRRPIANNSSPGQAVYDPFLGSGTTLIAAEKEGRVLLGMELEPAYVDVIVTRYVQWCEQNGRAIALRRNGTVLAPEELLALKNQSVEGGNPARPPEGAGTCGAG